MKRITSLALLIVTMIPLPLHAKGTITGEVQSGELREVSGIAAGRANPDVVWLHNDGQTNRLFGVRTTGETAAVLEWPNAMVDFEDVASGPGASEGETYLYIGDIGDNEARRPQVRVYRTSEPKLASSITPQYLSARMEDFRFRYPDGPVDAEALLVDPLTGDIYIVTKERKHAQVFRAVAESLEPHKVVDLERVATINAGNVSAGDISADGHWIILRTEKDGWLWRRDALQSVAETLSRAAVAKVLVRHKAQAKNGEGVTFDSTGASYFTVSEGVRPPLARFPLPAGR